MRHSYATPPVYRRGSGTLAVAFVATMAVGVIYLTGAPEQQVNTQLPETQLPAPPPEPLEAVRIVAAQPPAPPPENTLVADTPGVAEPVIETELAPEPYQTDNPGEISLDLFSVAADMADLKSWLQTGLIVIQVVGDQGVYIQTADKNFVRQTSLQNDPRSGLYYEANMSRPDVEQLRLDMVTSGLVDVPLTIEIVFTQVGLQRILQVQDHITEIASLDQTANKARLCAVQGDIGYLEDDSPTCVQLSDI